MWSTQADTNIENGNGAEVEIDSTGLLHFKAKEFFESVAKYAETEKKIHHSVLNTFF
jgi:hypothetical protein